MASDRSMKVAGRKMVESMPFGQFLAFTGAKDATIQAAKIANYHHPQFPELEDFGDMTLTRRAL